MKKRDPFILPLFRSVLFIMVGVLFAIYGYVPVRRLTMPGKLHDIISLWRALKS